MFYHLFYPLADQLGFMRLFGYITFRSAFGAIAEELQGPGLDDRLGIPLVRPVFAVRATS